MSTESNTAAATTSATTAAAISSTMVTTGPAVNTLLMTSMMPTPGFYPSSSTTPWEFICTHGLTGGSTSSGSVGFTFSGSFESFNGSSAGPFGSLTGIGTFRSNTGVGSFGSGTTLEGSMHNMNIGISMLNHNVGSFGGNGIGSFRGPSVAPLAPRMMPPAKKPPKFRGSDFKRRYQKMLFYLTTLGITNFLTESEPPKHYVNLGRLGTSSRNRYTNTDKSHKKEIKAQISQGIKHDSR